jgi:hypothetical protein
MRNTCLFSIYFLLSASAFSQHRTLFPFQAENGLCGYQNARKKTVIQPVFEKALPFENDSAPVKQNGKWGLLNGKGQTAIPPQYDTLSRLGTGWLAGNYANPPSFQCLHFPKEIHYGWVSAENKILQPLDFQSITLTKEQKISVSPFQIYQITATDSLISVKASRIFIDTLRLLPPLDTLPLVWDWRMPYRLGRTWGFVDSAGLMRISNRYEAVLPFSEKLAAVKFNGGWGFIDKEENIIIQPNFESVTSLRNGLSIAGRNGKFGIINRTGKALTGFVYDRIRADSSGIFVAEKAGRQGFIHREGSEALPPRFDAVSPQSDGKVIVRRGSLWGLMNEKGNLIFPVQYTAIYFEPCEKLYVLLKAP